MVMAILAHVGKQSMITRQKKEIDGHGNSRPCWKTEDDHKTNKKEMQRGEFTSRIGSYVNWSWSTPPPQGISHLWKKLSLPLPPFRSIHRKNAAAAVYKHAR